MSNIWERFDAIASPEEVQKSIEESSFQPFDVGDYDVVLEEIAPSESNQGLPMVKGKFRTMDNRVMFYNQMLQNINNPQMTAVNIAEAVRFISALVGEEITFTSLSALASKIQEAPIGSTYKVRLSYGKKDTERRFPKLQIIEKIDNEDIPF